MQDIDGNVYKTIKIGDQWWMAENLKVTHYRNGDVIHHETDNRKWGYLTTGAYGYYNNNSSNAAVYGALYNWYAVNDSRNIAPAGWHVPTDKDWKQLEINLGMSQAEADVKGTRGTNEGGKLKEAGTSHWYSPNTGATNESGFCARPGGYRFDYNNYFADKGFEAYFWSATEINSSLACSRQLYYTHASVNRTYKYKFFGFSIRLVRN